VCIHPLTEIVVVSRVVERFFWDASAGLRACPAAAGKPGFWTVSLVRSRGADKPQLFFRSVPGSTDGTARLAKIWTSGRGSLGAATWGAATAPAVE
jgi:hypothetical protein